MDDQARAIGRRVRYWRLRRNLDRRPFADMVGRSASWLDKIEKGERNLLRLPMLERVAEVLGVDPAALTDDSTARRAAGCVDPVEVRTIRQALSWYPWLSVRGSERVALARATRSVARSLTSTGQLPGAINALTGMADRMRPELTTRAGELLSLYGMLYLAASIAAAKQEDAETALIMHEHANTAAENFGPRYETHQTVFGLTNVALHRVAALVRLHEPGRALEYARNIGPRSISALPPERKVNYMLDITTAYTETGHYTEAARTLVEAERVAPEEIRCRPVAHGLIRAMARNTSGDLGNSIVQLASRAGVTI